MAMEFLIFIFLAEGSLRFLFFGGGMAYLGLTVPRGCYTPP
jgi:hypothetical protein